MQIALTARSPQQRTRNRNRNRAPARCGLRTTLLTSCAVAFLAAGCAVKPPTVVVEELLEPLSKPQVSLPTAADLAAAKLARIALVSSRANANTNTSTNAGDSKSLAATPSVPHAVSAALRAVENTADSEERKRLVPLAIDLQNATLDDPIAYRDASRALKSRGSLDPRIKGRLDRMIDNDPVRLARSRDLDGWHRLWARTFNTISEPLGSSLITGFVLAPYQLGNSILHYLAGFSNAEPLSVTGRQALVLRQEFLAAHPETPLTPKLERQIEFDLVKLEKTLAKRRLRAAERALKTDEPRLALHHAEAARALLHNHPQQNTRLRRRVKKREAQAAKTVAQLERRRALALTSLVGPPAVQQAERDLAVRLLQSPIDPVEFASTTADYASASAATAGEDGKGKIEFLRALSLHEAGAETASRKRLARLSESRHFDDPMTRHARTLEEDAWQNPYGAFRRLERGGRREELSWRLAGEWINRPRYPNLPAPLAYLIDTPTIAMTIVMAPLRAVISPWTGGPDFGRGAALAGYRYLVRYPEGEDQKDVVEWLYAYESGQERWGRALRLADLIDDFDPDEREDLVEKTAESRLARVDRIDRRDSKSSILEGVAREFPDSEGGQTAGMMARAEFQDASPQHIRITRDFLMENPSVAGRNGLGLSPKLLNDDPADGELHADGILLRGGRVLEILLIAEGGDDKTPAEPRVRRVSRERLARIAAALDEAVQRNSLVDTGARQAADASRDLYLERAGLGVTETPDLRATAESQFVYQSLRERYGMVRGRDSLLPFDLVFRGNLGDFTLGAFPRWRPPRETPDAFLYR